MSEITLLLGDLDRLVRAALEASGTSPENAAQVAAALVAAEAEGQAGHGIARVPSYAGQARTGKVDGKAVPELGWVGAAALRVDARSGFAYPAISAAIEGLAECAPETGIAAASVTNSHHFGIGGYHAERLADRGLVGLVFGNSPKAVAPWAGRGALYGTNPIAFAAPREHQPALVIDLSLSVAARGKIMVAAARGEPIPEGWALDAAGRPTTDAHAAMAGTLLAIGGVKGAALVMMVEILAAALTGAHFGYEASSFFEAEGPAPHTGQFLIAIAPGGVSGGAFSERLETLLAAVLAQDGVILPGSPRIANRERARARGVTLDRSLYDKVLAIAEG